MQPDTDAATPAFDRNLYIQRQSPWNRRSPPSAWLAPTEAPAASSHGTLARAVDASDLKYARAFASRQPRLAGPKAYRNGTTLALGEGPHSGSEWRALRPGLVREPGRASSAFLTSPRERPPLESKAMLRCKVLEGLPAYQGDTRSLATTRRPHAPPEPFPGARRTF